MKPFLLDRPNQIQTARYDSEAPKLKPFFGLVLETHIEANFRILVRRMKGDSKRSLEGIVKLLDLSSV